MLPSDFGESINDVNLQRPIRTLEDAGNCHYYML